MEALVPLLVAASALPALGISAWYARHAAHPVARGIALRWALIALAMLLGAAGLYWAGHHEARATTVVVLMVIVVNVLAISMVLHMRRADRGP